MPEPLIQGVATRVMSLRDGTKKMSKSDESDASRINMTDSPDLIIKKLKKSKTDSIAEITYDQAARPEVSNLINIYSALTKESQEIIVNKYDGQGFAKFKLDLADVIIEKLDPINQEYQKIIQDKAYIKNVLSEGAAKARLTAQETCKTVSKEFGLL
jgi:tryptophanyl-tRNA synthetase